MNVKDLLYMSAQPATNYYAWQTEIYLDNFRRNNIPMELVHVVLAIEKGDNINENWIKLKIKNPECNFFFYEDTRVDTIYSPSIQPHILAKHFSKFEGLKDKKIFLHDCDMIFTRPMDLSKYLSDEICYMSNVRSYIGPEYLKSKGEGLFEMMCAVVGICDCKVNSEADNTGGAQRLITGLGSDYWEEVERNSVELYRWLLDNKDRFSTSEVNDIQIWTSGMWSELWNIWKRGITTKTPDEFNFCWPTSPSRELGMVSMMHNAGASNGNGMFVKSNYITSSPYNSDIEVRKDKCSYFYYESVLSTGKDSKLEL